MGPLNITLVKKTLVSTIDAFIFQPSPVRPPADEQVAQPTREPGESLPTPLKAWRTQQGFLALGHQKAQGFFGIKHKLEKLAERDLRVVWESASPPGEDRWFSEASCFSTSVFQN